MKRIDIRVPAFTLSEMIVVLLLTAIVVGLAFTVLNLVQKQFASVRDNFQQTTAIDGVEQQLWIDLYKSPEVTYDDGSRKLTFESPLRTTQYSLDDQYIEKEGDTLKAKVDSYTFYYEGEVVSSGKVDALRIEFDRKLQNRVLFVFKKKDAEKFMN